MADEAKAEQATEVIADAPVPEQGSSEQNVEAQAQVKPEAKTPSPTDEKVDRNWREARRIMQEQQQRIAELETNMRSREPPKDDIADLDPEDIITVKQARKMVAREAKKMAEDVYRDREVATMEERVSLKYPDYADVVQKYIPDLINEDPALADAIKHSPNPYETAYKMAKKSYLYHKDQQAKVRNPDAEKINRNAVKPQSSNAVGKASSLGSAGEFMSLSDNQIWEMAQKFSQGK